MQRTMARFLALSALTSALVGLGAALACQAPEDEAVRRARGTERPTATRGATDHRAQPFGAAPPFPAGALTRDVAAALDEVIGQDPRDERWGPRRDPVHGEPPGGVSARRAALERVVASADPRLGWVLADLMRFTTTYEQSSALSEAIDALLGIETNPRNPWGRTTDHLIAWDVPAPPDYLAAKRRIHCAHVPEWRPFFVPGDLDWRIVSWGGVRADLRPYGHTDEPCNCIPAADEPPVTSIADAAWLADDAIVFGLTVAGESRAYPRRIMEVRELINDTLGGRAIGVPYCTLCGSAQAYFTAADSVGFERLVLRTSGLLARSNKVMFELTTHSLIDTFRGHAVTGPLAERHFVLEPIGVVTTTFGAWKRAHPDSTVLAESLALGRDFDFRGGRDAQGPIFPIGDVDPRLPAQAEIFGVVDGAGRAHAFEATAAREALARGTVIEVDGVQLLLDGGGLRARNAAGEDLAGHIAFWFAWSQFYDGTALWPG